MMTARTTRIGIIAAAVVGAESALLRAERDVEDLLDALFGDWQHFEVGPDFSIDVYGVTPSPAAIDALQRAGFVTVWLHEHPNTQFTSCACRRR